MHVNNIEEIVTNALKEAVVAAKNTVADSPTNWFPCGFAWVTIKPATGPLIKYLKENNIGAKANFGSGWVIYDPANTNTQRMDAKLAGARAFAKVINASGYDCSVSSRED